MGQSSFAGRLRAAANAATERVKTPVFMCEKKERETVCVSVVFFLGEAAAGAVESSGRGRGAPPDHEPARSPHAPSLLLFPRPDPCTLPMRATLTPALRAATATPRRTARWVVGNVGARVLGTDHTRVAEPGDTSGPPAWGRRSRAPAAPRAPRPHTGCVCARAGWEPAWDARLGAGAEGEAALCSTLCNRRSRSVVFAHAPRAPSTPSSLPTQRASPCPGAHPPGGDRDCV